MLNEDETAPVMPDTSRARLLEMIFSTGTIQLREILGRGRVNGILLVHMCEKGLSYWQHCASCVAPCLPLISSRNGAAGTRQQGKPKLPRNTLPIFMQSDLRKIHESYGGQCVKGSKADY